MIIFRIKKNSGTINNYFSYQIKCIEKGTNKNIFLIHYNKICFLSFVELFSILHMFLAKTLV